MATMAESKSEWLPLDTIALSMAPTRQIRDVSEQGVQQLLETDPTTWDAIVVRPWPEGEDYPAGEEGRPYQVVAGYHRVSAARRMEMPKGILAIVRNDLTSDQQFLLVALASNLRHGERMQRADIVVQMKRMRDEFGMSIGDISKSLSLPKSTVSAWLTGRDTNAGRSSSNETGNRNKSLNESVATAKAWGVAPTPTLTEREAQVVDDAINDALAADPSARLKPADVLAWVTQLQPARRKTLAKGIPVLADFWTQLSHILAAESEN